MAKLPFMQFYTSAWIEDTIGLSANARAAWMDIICFLWNYKTRGTAKRTHLTWSNLVRLQPEVFSEVLMELDAHEICTITIDGRQVDEDDDSGFQPDDEVTLSSRRMLREEIERNSHRLAQRKYEQKKESDTKLIRPDSDLIQSDPEKLEVRSYKLEVREEKKERSLVGLTPDGANGSGAASLWTEAEALLGFLNKKTGKHFAPRLPKGQPTKALASIHALLRKGYSDVTIRQVIANRWLKWGNDEKMQEFLRPITLFRPSNFENYLGELGKGQTDASL